MVSVYLGSVAGGSTKLDLIQFLGVSYSVIDWTFSADRTVVEIAGRKI